MGEEELGLKAFAMKTQMGVWVCEMHLVVSFLALSLLVGCSAGSQLRSAPDPVSLDASGLVGQRITVKGYIRYEFENRALYPAGKRTRKAVRAACLPILVRRDDVMDRRVSTFNGKVVTVTGVIDSLAEPGMVSVGMCKQSGIVVETITAQ